MSRLHMHVRVKNLDESIKFYSAMFGAEPSVRKTEYAKWMLDDPRMNFAISQPGDGSVGINHIGIQADSDEQLEEIETRLKAIDVSPVQEADAKCCYANSNKHWTIDPNGLVWESFHTMGEAEIYNELATQEKLLNTHASETSSNCC